MMVADTHVHVYPCYPLGAAFRGLAARLASVAEADARLAFLAERAGGHFFRELASGGASSIEGSRVTACAGGACLVVEADGAPPFHLFPGRQIVAAERIEILALTVDDDMGDGLAARDVIRRVLDAGGIPVLAWAPGKWFFGRGRVVRGLIANAGPGRLLLGDTTLRPSVWPEPRLMRMAAARGLGVVAGSDPLPLPGEEAVLGTYATLIAGGFDLSQPVASARAALQAPTRIVARVGRRGGLGEVIGRLRRHAGARRSS